MYCVQHIWDDNYPKMSTSASNAVILDQYVEQKTELQVFGSGSAFICRRIHIRSRKTIPATSFLEAELN